MTGLEKILKHIEEDATTVAEAIVTEAKSKAEEMISLAQVEAEKKHAAIVQQSKTDVDACLSRGASAALLQEKKLILNAKQQIIGNVITSAKDSLMKLPEKEYFDIIIKMVQKYALAKPGQILFSDTDNERMPEQFEAILCAALLDIEGAELIISKKTRAINGGFVLLYGDVEENCSFDALFLAAKESLQDKVCELLFQ